MEKWMIVYLLPLEVWMDIFCFPWIGREKFGKIVYKIGNFKFAEHAQFFLHEWGRRKLDCIKIDKKGFHNYSYDVKPFYLDAPQTALPENIKSFEFIRIGHFDVKAIDFLGKIQPLLANLDLKLLAEPAHLKELRIICTHLAPLLGGIHFLNCSAFSFPMMQQCFSREKLAQCKWLNIDFTIENAPINPILEWLIQPEGNAGPKLCEASFYCKANALSRQISMAVREQFLSAKTSCTFAVFIRPSIISLYLVHKEHLPEFHLENRIGEEMHGMWDEDGESFQITRHRPNGKAGLEEWIEAKTNEWGSCGRIVTYNTTAGRIAAAQIGVPPGDEEEQAEQQQQPSCSSKDA